MSNSCVSQYIAGIALPFAVLRLRVDLLGTYLAFDYQLLQPRTSTDDFLRKTKTKRLAVHHPQDGVQPRLALVICHRRLHRVIP